MVLVLIEMSMGELVPLRKENDIGIVNLFFSIVVGNKVLYVEF